MVEQLEMKHMIFRRGFAAFLSNEAQQPAALLSEAKSLAEAPIEAQRDQSAAWPLFARRNENQYVSESGL